MKRALLIAALGLVACSTVPSKPVPTGADLARFKHELAAVKGEVAAIATEAKANPFLTPDRVKRINDQVAKVAQAIDGTSRRLVRLAEVAGIDTNVVYVEARASK